MSVREQAPASERIKAEAYAAGFDLAGITRLGPVATAAAFDAWLQRGFAGKMNYLPRRAAERRDSRLPFPGARSAIVVAMNYGGTEPPGPVARYARGRDYHDVLRERLQEMHQRLERLVGRPVAGRAFVDTGPLLERDLARRAGLGWFGKNTNLINPRLGSFFFIGALLVELDLAPDAPFEADRCGTCRKCIDACPTDAIVEPRLLDARRCISYLTIELREAIPRELRPLIGSLVFGCDVCQDVCPWNVRFARNVSDARLAPRRDITEADPVELLRLDDDAFRSRFHGSAVTRAKRPGLARNAAVVLGNRADASAVPALATALSGDPEPIVRGHAAWALGRFPDDARAIQALVEASEREEDATVLEEIAIAFEHSVTARASDATLHGLASEETGSPSLGDARP